MRPIRFDKLDFQTPATNSDRKSGAGWSLKRYHDDTDARDFGNASTPLTKRICRVSLDSANSSPTSREQLGGKGMFLQRMVEAGLPVPPFKCATTEVVNALERHPFDTVRLARYLPEIVAKLEAETSLADIKQYLQTLPPSEQAKRDNWLQGLTQFVASDDFYKQVKDSQAAKHIRALRTQLGEPSTPVIVRSSGINEDNYGDAQAGKYLSEVQGENDVLRTCLNVMASSYRPEVCAGGAPQPMALILQQCIDCQYGGVAMSYQSLQDDTVRVEYTSGQPRGAVAGQYGTTPHRIDIAREEGADHPQYFPGTASSHFILRKNSTNNGYTETEIGDVGTQSDGDRQRLTDDQIASLMQMVRMLEDLLGCPVDIEFGIDHLGQVFLLQVRPITRLSGGMDFAVPPPEPEETLASGIGVSEGYCTGPLWLATNQATESMPEGAIVVAQHGEVWMLEPDVLKRAAGFVFATGGTNDHVAITLRQAEKPCLLADGQYPALTAHKGEQATLACARFNGAPCAFVVTGDLTEKLASHRSSSPAIFDVPLESVASADDLSPPEGTFSQVATGFRWLTDQNARLLAFFAPGGDLDCLAHPVKLSMSARRSEILAATQTRIQQLTQGAQALLDGYQAFLLLGGDSCLPGLKPLRAELPQLNTRFETLKQTIRSELESVTLPLRAGDELPVSPGTFRQWMIACHQLHSSLQALHPLEAVRVRSIHDLIFALHKRFVSALAPVTLASGQGEVSEKWTTYVDCTPPDKEALLLTPSCKAAIENLGDSATVFGMVDALLINLALGEHVGLIELLEHAEGGKGRTLRLKFSDHFDKPDGSDNPAKLKRMWFLVQLLRAIEVGKDAGSMKLSCNAVAKEIIIEYPHMTSIQAANDALEKMITVLSEFWNKDTRFARVAIFEEYQWNFDLLAQCINRDLSAEADSFAFGLCIFTFSYYQNEDTLVYYPLLNDRYQQLINRGRWLGKCIGESKRNLREVLMSDEIDENTRKELLHYLFFVSPAIVTPIVDVVYGDLQDQYFVFKPSPSCRPEFYIQPSQLPPANKEKVKRVLLDYGLKYASQRVRSDKEVVLPAIAARASDLKYVSEELKNDKDVVMTAVTQGGYLLEYASPKLQDDDEVVIAAVKQFPTTFMYASERIRGDKNIIKVLIAGEVDILATASETVLNDRRFLLELIEDHPSAIKWVACELQRDEEFIRSAIQRNPEVCKQLPTLIKNHTNA